MLLEHRYPLPAHGVGQRALDLGAGGVAAGVQHPERAVPALPAAGQRPVGGGVEDGAATAQPRDRGRAVGQDRGHGVRLAQARAGRDRVRGVPFGRISALMPARQHDSDAALRPLGTAVAEGRLRHHDDAQARLAGAQRGGQPGRAAADHDEVRAGLPFRRHSAAARMADRDHPPNGCAGPAGHGRLDVHFVPALPKRAQQRGRSDHLHVPAGRPVVHREELDPRSGLAELVQHPDLGRHQDRAGASLPGRGRHAAGGQDLDPVGRDHPLAGQVERRRGTAAFGVDEQLGLGYGRHPRRQVRAADRGVHVTLAGPDEHVLPAGDPPHVRAEELIRAEQHLPAGRDRVHHLGRVR